MSTKRIGFLGFDGIMALDMVGPMDTFAAAANAEQSGLPGRIYDLVVIGLTQKTFIAESGLVLRANRTLQTAPALDTLIIPGGRGLRNAGTNAKISTWLRSNAHGIRRIASVCTGIYALAPTGLLDGRSVTTHWKFARDVAERYPKLKVNSNALFLKDGPFYTSAGITAGIDLSLALIEEDCGANVALSVARELVVYLKRTGGQEQYSEPLQFQVKSSFGSFPDLPAWMSGHLQHDLSVDTLAERVHLCPRHFSRRFKTTFGSTPGDFVNNMRLDEARRRLAARESRIDTVGTSVGFASASSFRRAFERRFGTSPSSYRDRFKPSSPVMTKGKSSQ